MNKHVSKVCDEHPPICKMFSYHDFVQVGLGRIVKATGMAAIVHRSIEGWANVCGKDKTVIKAGTADEVKKREIFI